jgi:hypothetical protein
MSETVEVAPAPPQLDSTVAAGRAAKAGIGGAADAKKAAAGAAPAAPPPPPPQAPAPSGNAQSEIVARSQPVNGRDYSSLSPVLNKTRLDVLIAAPGGKKLWSVGPSGQITFSGDAGHTWNDQSSGVAANLTGGSAPSDKVCWIGGAAGTLLRTTDGGKTWQIVSTPFSGDVSGVQAADAQHASIREVASGKNYETSDGGASWIQKAKQ